MLSGVSMLIPVALLAGETAVAAIVDGIASTAVALVTAPTSLMRLTV